MDQRIEDSVRTPRELSGADEEGGRFAGRYIQLARDLDERRAWADLNWAGPLADYLDLVRADPRLARNAWQRLYDMLMSYGADVPTDDRERPVHYRFFDDPRDGGREAIFGIEESLSQLVAHMRAAAHGLGAERRVLLLHGPVGSSKSTIARLL
jgi:serine protein kinase